MADLYRKLASVYHLLFPARTPQLGMITRLAGEPGGRILDVASGTGEYVAALADLGYSTSGIELDGTMHTQALLRHPELMAGEPSQLIQGDMLQLERLVGGSWQLAFSIGNSLPHLARDADVASVLAALWQLTRPGGKVLLQVANFDRVLRDARRECVPTVERAGGGEAVGLIYDLPPLTAALADDSPVEFARQYMLRRATDMAEPGTAHDQLVFRTRLSIGGESYEAATPLLVLTRERLGYCLPRAAEAQWLGDFASSEWRIDSPATIVVLG